MPKSLIKIDISYELDTDSEIESLESEIESYTIDACVFSPDGRYIATYSKHGEIQIWDSGALGKEIWRSKDLKQRDLPNVDFALSDNGNKKYDQFTFFSQNLLLSSNDLFFFKKKKKLNLLR